MSTVRRLPIWLAGLLTIVATASAARNSAPPDLDIVVYIATANIASIGSESTDLGDVMAADINAQLDEAFAADMPAKKFNKLINKINKSIDKAFKSAEKEMDQIRKQTIKTLARYDGTQEMYDSLSDAVFATTNIIEIEKQELLDLVQSRLLTK